MNHCQPPPSIDENPVPRSARSISTLPGPAGLPWLGNLFQLDRIKPHVTFEKWGEAYGPIFRFRLANKKFVGLTPHEDIQQLLRERPGRVRRMRSIETVIDEIAGTGLFSAEGATWQRQRRLTAPAFSTANLKTFFPLIARVTDRLLGLLRRRARESEPFEIQRDLMKYTVDVTTWLSLNRDVNTLEIEGDDFQRDLEQLFPALSRRINAPFPYWRYVQIGPDRELRFALQRLRARIGKIITAQRGIPDQTHAGDTGAANLLEALISARDAESQLSDEEIFGNIITILTAGEDTTAYSLAWALMFIADHPGIQRRSQEEARRVLGERETVDTFADLEKLEFIEAVALESMRVKPVAPILFLELNEEMVVRDTLLPKGTIILGITSLDARAESNFTHGSEFRPERWLTATRPESWKHNIRAFMPFGAGTRVCPGRSLAMVEMKSVLAMICRNFEVVRTADFGPVDERFAFTTLPVNLFVQLTESPAYQRVD
jgi:cytochrome P450